MKNTSLINKITTSVLAIVLAVSVTACGETTDNSRAEAVSIESEGASVSDNESLVVDETETVTAGDIPVQETGTEEEVTTEAETTVSGQEVSDNEAEPIGEAVVEEPEKSEEQKLIESLTEEQKKAINTLNYLTVLSQKINSAKDDPLILDNVYSSLENDIFPEVDSKTQVRITSMMTTIQKYQLIDEKRERIQYIYEQNRAQALRQLIPNPIGLLSAVKSKNPLEAIASVLYMAVDSISGFFSSKAQADLQNIKDGWELDDEAKAELHQSTINTLNYMFDMVRDYDIPGDFALSKEAIEDYIKWAEKSDSELDGKISWFTEQGHYNTYKMFGPYWLELAQDYYKKGEYEKCLESIESYERITTRVLRKDADYARVLPMAIVSAKNTMESKDYVEIADKYCSIIRNNTKDSDWVLRYFVAQTYIENYEITNDSAYIDKAYDITFNNVNNLVGDQRALNDKYQAELTPLDIPKDASKSKKKQIKAYNKALKKQRETELPPVNDALYWNCDRLFDLVKMKEEINRKEDNEAEKRKIESILHIKRKDGETTDEWQPLFLTKPLDDYFWFIKLPKIDEDAINIEFKGTVMSIPAPYISDRYNVDVTVSGKPGPGDWTVTNVTRPKNAGYEDFIVSLKSDEKYEYKDGDVVKVVVTPVDDASGKPKAKLIFQYKVVPKWSYAVTKAVNFERVTK